MKTLRLFIAFLMLFGMASSQAQTNKTTKTETATISSKVEVFYFHYSRRCETCKAVEDVSREAVLKLYGNKVSFTGYNLDEADGEKKAKELGVSGQTLLIVSGKNKTDITNDAFMNARSNPEKLKQIIKEKTNLYL